MPGLGLEAAVAGVSDGARPARAVVHAMLALAPELDDRGPEPVAAPVRGTREPQPRLLVVVGRAERVRSAVALRGGAHPLVQGLPRGDGRALLARDRGQPAAPGSAREVVVA